MIQLLIGSKLRELTHIEYYVNTATGLIGKSLAEIRTAEGVIWQAIRSCFGRGHWVEDKPWLDDDSWKD